MKLETSDSINYAVSKAMTCAINSKQTIDLQTSVQPLHQQPIQAPEVDSLAAWPAAATLFSTTIWNDSCSPRHSHKCQWWDL